MPKKFELVELVARAIGARLSRDSKGKCLLIATDDQCVDIALAALDAIEAATTKSAAP